MKKRLLFGLIMSATMALVMSFVMTLINVGPVNDFLLIWLRSFGIGFTVAFPTSFLASSLAQKITCRIAEEEIK